MSKKRVMRGVILPRGTQNKRRQTYRPAQVGDRAGHNS